jgi:hypothetical protein
MAQSAGDRPRAGGARARSSALSLAAALAVGLALLLPQVAVGAEGRGSQSPSADELWHRYPLQPRESQQRDRARTGGAAPADDGPGAATAAIAALAVVGLGLAAGAAGRASIRRRRPARATPRPADTGAADAAAVPGRPPEPARSWTAEIEWPGTGDEVRFRAVAGRAPHAQHAVIAQSRPFRWPPRETADVQAMTDAVGDVERLLLAAGWTEIEPGNGWFAKRFAWTPASRRAGDALAEAGDAG